MAMYVVSFLDRANIGFAKQALAASVGISESTYALGAGLFFISYSLCGFPSNLILHKIGAKFWISFLMVGWGLASMATMFVRGATSFYLLRLLLGVMEAGFFPGAILYLTYWFPNRVRGRILGLFYLGVPLALIVGGPLSGLLLEMHPLGSLLNWQWMFLVEGFSQSPSDSSPTGSSMTSPPTPSGFRPWKSRRSSKSWQKRSTNAAPPDLLTCCLCSAISASWASCSSTGSSR